MKKFKKLMTKPGIFFRDFFTKRYPIINCEQAYSEQEEFIVIKNQYSLTHLESQLAAHTQQSIDVVFTWVNSADIRYGKINVTSIAIMSILKQAESGTPVATLCREHGMNNVPFYKKCNLLLLSGQTQG